MGGVALPDVALPEHPFRYEEMSMFRFVHGRYATWAGEGARAFCRACLMAQEGQ